MRIILQESQETKMISVLSNKVLANKIRENKDIKGITVCRNKIKISQYADDTAMI